MTSTIIMQKSFTIGHPSSFIFKGLLQQLHSFIKFMKQKKVRNIHDFRQLKIYEWMAIKKMMAMELGSEIRIKTPLLCMTIQLEKFKCAIDLLFP